MTLIFHTYGSSECAPNLIIAPSQNNTPKSSEDKFAEMDTIPVSFVLILYLISRICSNIFSFSKRSQLTLLQKQYVSILIVLKPNLLKHRYLFIYFRDRNARIKLSSVFL